LENRESVDQKTVLVRQHVTDLIAAHREVLAEQGTVVEGWREYGGHRLGPYFRLAYRIEGRQGSIYLGADQELAEDVRGLLADLQAPHRRRLALSRLCKRTKKSLANHKQELRAELAKIGLYLKGNEVRGVRNLTCCPQGCGAKRIPVE